MLSWLLVLLRACQFAAALVLLGTITFLMLLRRWQPAIDRAPASSGRPRYLRLAIWTLAVAALTLPVWLLAQARMMAGEDLTLHLVEVVAWDTQFGRIMLWRLAALLLLAALLGTSLRSRWLEGMAVLAAAADLTLLVWVGHVAAAAQTSSVQVAAQIAHLLALGVWIGGLPAFLVFLTAASLQVCERPLLTAANMTRAFSQVCTACVVVVVASGICNAIYLLPSAADLIHTAYGGLLLVKLGILAVLLGFAADNLWRQRPGLEHAANAPVAAAEQVGTCLRRLRSNVAVETALAVAILLVVAALGLASPPA